MTMNISVTSEGVTFETDIYLEALTKIANAKAYIETALPNSREKSCAITKLDEAFMWIHRYESLFPTMEE